MTRRANSHEFTEQGIIDRMRETGSMFQYIQLAKQFHVSSAQMKMMLDAMVVKGMIVAEKFDRRMNFGLTARQKQDDRRSEPREPFYMRPPLNPSYAQAMANFRAGCEGTRK